MRQQQYTLPLGDAIAIAAHLDGLTFTGSDYNERLGHSSIALTLDTYSHVLPGMQADATNVLDRMLRIT